MVYENGRGDSSENSTLMGCDQSSCLRVFNLSDLQQVDWEREQICIERPDKTLPPGGKVMEDGRWRDLT